MWTRLATVALCLASLTAQVQAADDNMSRLESCIQAARLADTICSKIANDPTQRGNCFAKGRAAQLECLDRVLSEAPGAPAASLSSETARPEPPPEAALPKLPAERPTADESGRTDQPSVSVGSATADEAAKLSNAAPEPAPASAPLPMSPPPAVAEAPTGAIRTNGPENGNVTTARETEWVISETTSPVDYSPLVTAVLSSTSNVKNGPNTLTVRCRAQQTELSIRTDGAWGVPRGNELPVDYQISGQPVVRQPWVLSADGRTATYKNDSVELLRSIPDGATLKIAVADRGNVRLAATFEPTGLAGVRQKVGTACKWATPPAAKTSSETVAPKAVVPGALMRARQGRM
jgi:hypothetical protein